MTAGLPGPEAVFENSAANAALERIRSFFQLSRVDVPHRVVVKFSGETEFLERFPAAIRWREGSESATVVYCRQAVADVASAYGYDPETFVAVEQLYLFGSISLGILVDSLSGHNSNIINLLIEQLVLLNDIEKEVDDLDEVDDAGKIDLKHALNSSSDERRLRTGCLRFVTGMYGILQDETGGFEQLRMAAKRSLLHGLERKKEFAGLLTACNVFPEGDLQYRTDRQFMDAVSEVTIALVFPMNPEELRAVVKLVTTSTE